ncbi:hypothetical protein MD588_01815 [Photobacterium sp. SDRW27]|uniref:hypothetical protein n=1 Tax=Photobacterium obscurum TaxID=2829490 RepID=UPI0022432259|nr:hypothetical protein [Photobacterium obscurum]MCW8327538.1 hypothetical protein [Photobacterium obscurum]
MVSIQRLTPSIHSPQKPRVNKPATAPDTPQTTVVAKAVAKSVRDPELIQDAHAKIQYDQPEGRNRQAMDSYMGVMYQNRKDELSSLVGVDVYV